MTVEEAIAGRLLSDPSVAAVLGRRVYPDGLPAHLPPGPRAEIDLTGETAPDQLDGRGDGEFAVTVTVYALLKPTARLAKDRVRDSLDGYAGGAVSRMWWEATAAVETEDGYAYAVAFTGRYLLPPPAVSYLGEAVTYLGEPITYGD